MSQPPELRNKMDPDPHFPRDICLVVEEERKKKNVVCRLKPFISNTPIWNAHGLPTVLNIHRHTVVTSSVLVASRQGTVEYVCIKCLSSVLFFVLVFFCNSRSSSCTVVCPIIHVRMRFKSRNYPSRSILI